MSIVLEGPDRAGKTTLARFICGTFHSKIIHLGGSEMRDGKFVRHWDKVTESIVNGRRNTVYDRMVLGSVVYEFKRDSHNREPVTAQEYAEWMNWMWDEQNLLICCLPPLATVLERMNVGEEYITRDEMVTVWRRYETIFSAFKNRVTPFTVIFYDSSVTAVVDFFEAHRATFAKALL